MHAALQIKHKTICVHVNNKEETHIHFETEFFIPYREMDNARQPVWSCECMVRGKMVFLNTNGKNLCATYLHVYNVHVCLITVMTPVSPFILYIDHEAPKGFS